MVLPTDDALSWKASMERRIVYLERLLAGLVAGDEELIVKGKDEIVKTLRVQSQPKQFSSAAKGIKPNEAP